MGHDRDTTGSGDDYGAVLVEYLRTRAEQVLYRASRLSQRYIEDGLGPDEIIALHFEALDRALAAIPPREQVHAISDAHQFLLEVMIAYGVKYREYLELRLRESLREAEERAVGERERIVQLERAQQEKTELLATIAHELRTPLAGARGHVDLALRAVERKQFDRVPGQLGAAREAIDRLSRLTSDLFQASQGEGGALERTPLPIDDIVSRAYGWAHAAAAAKGIHLGLALDAGDCRVLGNADGLLSVVGNLLSNAIRYTSAGGRVTLQTSAQGDRVTVSVEDTGIGMAPDVQARIFEKFYRGPEARQREGQGLGLGLALVERLVAAHDGSVSVASEPGAGSTFRVLLPCVGDEVVGDEVVADEVVADEVNEGGTGA